MKTAEGIARMRM